MREIFIYSYPTRMRVYETDREAIERGENEGLAIFFGVGLHAGACAGSGGGRQSGHSAVRLPKDASSAKAQKRAS